MTLQQLKDLDLAPQFMTQEGFNTISNGYMHVGETPRDMYKRCAAFSASVLKLDDKYAIDFFDAMWNNWLCPATPVLSNAMSGNLQISCYSGVSSDNVLGIMDHLKELAVLTKNGGGVGSSYDLLRAAGSKISKGGTSSGIVPFLKMLDSTISGITQGANRRGAVASYLNIEHGDAEDFINIRSQTGDLSRKIQSVAFHNAITISDDVMNKIISGDTKYRPLFNQIMNQRVETGEPYIMFTDNANKNCPEEYKGIITQSNLCVAPETKILTSEGYIEISKLEGKEINVWNGETFSDVVVRKTGEDQKLLKVKTSSGQELNCTEYHKFYVQEGYKKGTGKNKFKIIIKRACELKVGDKLIKFDLPTIQGLKHLDDAYVNGFYTGDGCKVVNTQKIYLYGEKIKLKHLFNTKTGYCEESHRVSFFYKNLKEKFFIPDSTYTIDTRLNWLAGLLDSDGCLLTDRKYGTQSIQIASVQSNFLKNLQLMLQTLGVHSKVVFARAAGVYKLPANDKTGLLKDFNCKHVDRLLISSSGVQQLINLGLKCHRLHIKRNQANRDAQHFIKISEVLNENRLSDTYCFTEPIKNMGMFNGILTGNCSEIMAPVTADETFVCCLSSLNLAKYKEWKDFTFTNTGHTLIELSTYFLDAVITNFVKQTANMDGMQNARRFAERHRMLGLGVLGWHTLLQQEMIPFESFQAMQLNNEVFKKMREQSYKASNELAQLYGACDVNGVRRNTALLAVAPTMSNSLISGGVSQGIEPLTANLFSQKASKGTFIKKNAVLERVLNQNNLNTTEIWEQINKDKGSVKNIKGLSPEEKQVFLTAREINQYALVQQAAQRQKYIDQAQSLNLFFSTPTTAAEGKLVAKYINGVHLEAWQSGIKSLYYLKTESPLKGDTVFVDKEDGSCKSCEG